MDGTFEEYVASRGDALLRFAFLLSGDRHLAEDLVQEVLARVHHRWRRLDHVMHPDAYLRTAVVRQFLSWRRRRAGRETSLEAVSEAAGARPVGAPPAIDAAARHAARDEMWRLLAGLPRRQRAVLVLRYYEDLPDGDIAEVLGCHPATVRVHAARGLARLRGALATRPDPGPPPRPQPVGGQR